MVAIKNGSKIFNISKCADLDLKYGIFFTFITII